LHKAINPARTPQSSLDLLLPACRNHTSVVPLVLRSAGRQGKMGNCEDEVIIFDYFQALTYIGMNGLPKGNAAL
jgi:hypothetical protein